MKQRLLVDMDGVLADIYAQLIQYETVEMGITQRIENLNGKPEATVFKNAYEYINTAGFFRTLPVMEGSIKALELLNEKYDLFIVSAAMEFPNSLEEKFYWLEEHFPFITWKQIVFCGSKTAVKGDIMIDDHFKNLDYFEGRALLFSQPHNNNNHDHPHTRVNNWQEILHLLT
ncbi:MULTISPECIES: 5'(3')-deoxyribonucleotidase [Flavobacterium]|uniref:5' nucleotidase, NT5C type n=1 Tax=Flavobacterium TaxID=237 RepID=UPI00096209E3|nr:MULTISPECIES: 5'(3')-deoxyribonucleotidase [Flavobacterium]MBN9283848.1 5'(3')-deoxyribonucleotidase [Flavobacterium sp.]OJV68650.1 MAG: 5'(3')-deoxyribonucleotidase [Flavobacterium sp. 40-81]